MDDREEQLQVFRLLFEAVRVEREGLDLQGKPVSKDEYEPFMNYAWLQARKWYGKSLKTPETKLRVVK